MSMQATSITMETSLDTEEQHFSNFSAMLVKETPL